MSAAQAHRAFWTKRPVRWPTVHRRIVVVARLARRAETPATSRPRSRTNSSHPQQCVVATAVHRGDTDLLPPRRHREHVAVVQMSPQAAVQRQAVAGVQPRPFSSPRSACVVAPSIAPQCCRPSRVEGWPCAVTGPHLAFQSARRGLADGRGKALRAGGGIARPIVRASSQRGAGS
jgi:hypothetical protein